MQQPLTWAVAPSLLTAPAIQALADKGHIIVPLVCDADIILHERAWQLSDAMLAKPALLDTVAKAARTRKRQGDRST